MTAPAAPALNPMSAAQLRPYLERRGQAFVAINSSDGAPGKTIVVRITKKDARDLLRDAARAGLPLAGVVLESTEPRWSQSRRAYVELPVWKVFIETTAWRPR